MSQPDLKRIILDLRRWEPVMRDASTRSLPAIRASHAHTTGLQADSQPERATFTKDRFLRELQQIIDAAYSTGWQDTGSPYAWLAARADWGPKNGPDWHTHVENLESIHARWQQACEPAEEHSDWLCPSCGTAQLRWRHNQKTYACPACEYAGTAEHVANMRRYVITQADTWISKRQAIELFGFESRQALDHHIKAGHLNLVEGQIHTAQLRRLRRNP